MSRDAAQTLMMKGGSSILRTVLQSTTTIGHGARISERVVFFVYLYSGWLLRAQLCV
jgi:hypothetical protein